MGEHERGRLTDLVPAWLMAFEPLVRRRRVDCTSAEHSAYLPSQALAAPGQTGQLRGSHDDAVRALRTAESIFPTKVRRDAMVRDTLAVLLRHSRRDAVGQELRRMARRAGLPG